MAYETLEQALFCLDKTLCVIEKGNALSFNVTDSASGIPPEAYSGGRVLALAPPMPPALLGDPAFCKNHGITYPCYAGSMAHGISSAQLVQAMGNAGMLGFFGTAGLSLEDLNMVLPRLLQQCAAIPFGVNLLNRPDDRAWERTLVELLLQYGVTLVEASAYILPSPELVKYRVTGLRKTDAGTVIIKNNLIAKVSRVETARHFLEPPPPKLLEKLRSDGEITEEEACLAQNIPLATDITVEADSAGHTDHRPALAIFPAVLQIARNIQSERHYSNPPRVGLAGGIGTPAAAAAAFSMGAAYIVTGSVNQACVESGTSPQVRALLARAAQTDVTDAPAADLFERGGTVQVLKKGTRFAERANKLYAVFRNYENLSQIPPEQRMVLEKTIFRKPLEEIWAETAAFFARRNPRQLEMAEKNPKHKMALMFRWYLGNAVQWANAGVQDRIEDYQIWCGPSMGAFNAWTRDTFLEEPARRSAPVVALNLLYGAAMLIRLQMLRAQGLPVETDFHLPVPVETFSA